LHTISARFDDDARLALGTQPFAALDAVATAAAPVGT